MSFRQVFENIDRGRNSLALAILHGFGQIHFVKEHVAQLFWRIDVELASGAVIYFARFDVDFALQAGRHFFERFAVDFDPGFFHPCQHGHQRQIDFFIQLQ